MHAYAHAHTGTDREERLGDGTSGLSQFGSVGWMWQAKGCHTDMRENARKPSRSAVFWLAGRTP